LSNQILIRITEVLLLEEKRKNMMTHAMNWTTSSDLNTSASSQLVDDNDCQLSLDAGAQSATCYEFIKLVVTAQLFIIAFVVNALALYVWNADRKVSMGRREVGFSTDSEIRPLCMYG
jgi:hypothetical protein